MVFFFFFFLFFFFLFFLFCLENFERLGTMVQLNNDWNFDRNFAAPGETQSGVDVEHRRWTSIVDFQFLDRF